MGSKACRCPLRISLPHRDLCVPRRRISTAVSIGCAWASLAVDFMTRRPRHSSRRRDRGWTVIVPIPKVLLDASLKLLLDPGMIKLGIDLVRERYGTEWTILDGQGQFGSVRARFTLAAPPGVYPDWVLLTLQHDDGRRMVAHVSYGERVLLRLPDGHFQVLALFLARKLHQAHKPPLLAVAHTYRGLFIGTQRVVNLYCRIPGPADIATVLSARRSTCFRSRCRALLLAPSSAWRRSSSFLRDPAAAHPTDCSPTLPQSSPPGPRRPRKSRPHRPLAAFGQHPDLGQHRN
jgi:hypothetical protein